ncbi:MAG: Gfo/Idh/MocA family oxidoreductase [Clostridia bacterium]|nr:Gfo/Idh/MocA family oxidoreductase [Clostridia bacterium]
MFRVGIIGCGGISAVHAQVLTSLDNTKLTACADVIPERARRYGCAAYTDYLQMLDQEKLDAVHLCTPHYLHPVMAAEAARRGIAVFTEKPPAIDAEGWEQVKQAAKRVPVGVCFQNRYHPHIRTCKRYLADGIYGKLCGVRAFVTWNRGKAYYTSSDWKGKWATEGGGALINQAIHTLDLMLGFLGEPEQVSASMGNHHLQGCVEVEDTAEIYLKKGEIPALLYASTAYSQDAPVIIELHLEKAVIRLEGDLMTLIEDGKRQEIVCQTDPTLGRSYWGAGHKACIADFYRCITEGQPFDNRPDACETTMNVLLDVYRQAGVPKET